MVAKRSRLSSVAYRIGALLNQGRLQADGSWVLVQAQLSGLTLTPAKHSDDDFRLTIRSVSTEGENGSTAEVVDYLDVRVDAVADKPSLTVSNARGDEDTAIALDIQTHLHDQDGSETQHIIISGLPTGALLNQGRLQADGSWKLLAA